jgi:hypothetical protein
MRKIQGPRSGVENPMITEKIQVRVTESRQTMDVMVFSKRPERIEVVLGGRHP